MILPYDVWRWDDFSVWWVMVRESATLIENAWRDCPRLEPGANNPRLQKHYLGVDEHWWIIAVDSTVTSGLFTHGEKCRHQWVE